MISPLIKAVSLDNSSTFKPKKRARAPPDVVPRVLMKHSIWGLRQELQEGGNNYLWVWTSDEKELERVFRLEARLKGFTPPTPPPLPRNSIWIFMVGAFGWWWRGPRERKRGDWGASAAASGPHRELHGRPLLRRCNKSFMCIPFDSLVVWSRPLWPGGALCARRQFKEVGLTWWAGRIPPWYASPFRSPSLCVVNREIGRVPSAPAVSGFKKNNNNKNMLLPQKWVGEKLLTDFPGTSIMIIKTLLNCKSLNICWTVQRYLMTLQFLSLPARWNTPCRNGIWLYSRKWMRTPVGSIKERLVNNEQQD